MTTWWEGEKQGAWNLGKGEGMGEREAPQGTSNTTPPPPQHHTLNLPAETGAEASSAQAGKLPAGLPLPLLRKCGAGCP